jgi:glycosyltransferase involved in cell wall biosynthesis
MPHERQDGLAQQFALVADRVWSANGSVRTPGREPLRPSHLVVLLNGLEGARIVWNDIPILPGLGGEFGNDHLVSHAKSHFDGDPKGGMVFTLMDVWVLNPELATQLDMVCWCPVDHEPAPPAVQSCLVKGAVPLAMSKFGQEQLADLDPLYCPHGVDVDAYKPYDRSEVRRKIGVSDDAFLIGMVAANKGRPSRKGFQQALEAFRLFRDSHNDAFLYLHTTVNPDVAAGENIPALLKALRIPPDAVLVADQYRMLFDPYPPKTMAKIYSSMDVLINPAAGEGFGLPVLEAQACGVPCIVTDFSAMSEVCGAGWKIESRPFWTGQDSWQAFPDVEDLLDALKRCYGLPRAAKRQLADQARTHALQYAAPRVFEEHMLPALKAAEERFADREPVGLKVAA